LFLYVLFLSEKRPISKSSRDSDLTVLIPLIFSCTRVFKRPNERRILLNAGLTRLSKRMTTTAKKGMAAIVASANGTEKNGITDILNKINVEIRTRYENQTEIKKRNHE